MIAFGEIEKKYEAADKAMGNHDPAKAAHLFKELVETEPREPLFRWGLGYALSELKQYRRAVSELKQALELEPRNIAALGLLGRIYMQLGDWNHAEKAIRARLAAKRSPQHYIFLAHIMTEKGRHRAALECCRKAIDLDPTFAEAYLNLGLGYRSEKRFDDAVSAFQKAIEIDAKYSAAFRELGLTYFDLANFGMAEAALSHCLALDHHDAWGHVYLSLSLEQTGNITRAAKHFEKARKIDPQNQFIKKKHDEFQRLRSKAAKTKSPRATTVSGPAHSKKG